MTVWAENITVDDIKGCQPFKVFAKGSAIGFIKPDQVANGDRGNRFIQRIRNDDQGI